MAIDFESLKHPHVWMFHCYIEWYIAAGLVLTVINQPDQLGTECYPSFSAQEDLGFTSYKT